MIRSQPPAQGWAWFVQAINLGARNPRATFGAALLLIAAVYLLMLLAGLLMALVGGAAPADPMQLGSGPLLVMVLLMLALLALVPILIGGLMHVIREAEAGRPVRARDIFQPLRSGHAGRLAAFGAVQVAFMWIGSLVANGLIGADFMAGYTEFAQAVIQQKTPPAMPPVAHPLGLFLWQILFNYVSVTVMLLGIARVALSGRRFGEALRDAAQATWRNVAPNLLAAVLFLLALAGTAIVVTLVGSVVLVALGMLSTTLALVVGVIGSFARVSAVLVVVCGGGYLIWRDTFADGGADAGGVAPPPASGQFQA